MALKTFFWTAAAALAASALLTVLGSALNLEAVLRAGGLGWLAGCVLLFAWSVTFAFSRLALRGPGEGGKRKKRH